MAGRLIRGEIRLCRFPRPEKTRPVLILTRDSVLPFLAAVTVAPISSAIRGVASEVRLTESDGTKRPCAINLHNVVTVRKAYLGRRVAALSPERLKEVCSAMNYALGCM